jgi:hypothetical protein
METPTPPFVKRRLIGRGPGDGRSGSAATHPNDFARRQATHSQWRRATCAAHT